MRLETDEVITLDNNRDYVVVNKKEYDGNNYICLTSLSKPLEVLVGKEVIDGNDISIELLTEENEIKKIIDMF